MRYDSSYELIVFILNWKSRIDSGFNYVWARKWIFSTTQAIQVLKNSTFYSSRKSSLMTCISTSSESLSLSWYFIFGSRCRLCRLWVQTVQQRAGKGFFWVQTVQHRARNVFFGCRLCRLLGADCAAAGPEWTFWVQTVQQRARNEFIWVQTVQTMDELEIPKVGGNEIARERKRFRWYWNTCH